MFGPPLPSGGLFKKDKTFAEFLLTKIINAENAAHLSDKFVGMAIRTRKELLKDLATNYVTQTTLDSGSRFGLFTSAKKKDKTKPRFTPDCAGLKGALSWRVVAEDCSSVQTTIRSHSREVDAILGIRYSFTLKMSITIFGLFMQKFVTKLDIFHEIFFIYGLRFEIDSYLKLICKFLSHAIHQ